MAISRTYCGKHYMQAKRSDTLPLKQSYKGLRRNSGRTLFKKGQSSWNKGLLDWSSETQRQAISKANSGRIPVNIKPVIPQLKDGKITEWQGGGRSYRLLHRWINRHYPKTGTCSNCHLTGLTGRKIHWANISHTYIDDISDWIELCATCHKRYDLGKIILPIKETIK